MGLAVVDAMMSEEIRKDQGTRETDDVMTEIVNVNEIEIEIEIGTMIVTESARVSGIKTGKESVKETTTATTSYGSPTTTDNRDQLNRLTAMDLMDNIQEVDMEVMVVEVVMATVEVGMVPEVATEEVM